MRSARCLAASGVGAFEWDILRRRVLLDGVQAEIWGLQRPEHREAGLEISYDTFVQRIHPEDVPGFQSQLDRSVAFRTAFVHELRVVRSDGSLRRLLCRGELTFTHSGQPALMKGAVMQLSERLDPCDSAQSPLSLQFLARREQDFFDAVLDSLPGVFYLYHQNGKFLRWNRRFERATGYSASEISVMHPLDFFAQDCKSLVSSRIEEVFVGGASDVESDLLAKDGTRAPYHFTGVRAVIEGQSCLVGFGVSVEEREQAKAALSHSEARYRTLFEYAPDGIAITDPDSTYLDVNPSLCTMLGYPREELIGMHSSQLVVEAQLKEIEPTLAILKAGARYQREWQFRRKDGSVFPAEIFATMMPDYNLLVMFRDVTERKAVEKVLLDVNENLEQKAAERTKDLEAALIRAEAADRLKSSFLATQTSKPR